MKEKAILNFELSKEDVSGVFFMLGEQLTDEQWKELSDGPKTFDLSKLDKGDQRDWKVMLAALIIQTLM